MKQSKSISHSAVKNRSSHCTINPLPK